MEKGQLVIVVNKTARYLVRVDDINEFGISGKYACKQADGTYWRSTGVTGAFPWRDIISVKRTKMNFKL